MANSKKHISLVLDTQAIEEDFFEDTSLYAIRFSEHAYHAVWLFNKLLGTNFVLNKEYYVDTNFTFTQFQYFDSKLDLQHYIYTNRMQGNFLVRDLRGFHFFWLVRGEAVRNRFMLEAIKKITENSEVEIFQQLELETLDSKHCFLF